MFSIIMRYLAAFLAAVLSTSVLASVLSTQFVLALLGDLNIDVSFADRVAMTWADFGILPAMGMAVAACFLIGFPVAGLLASRVGGDRRLWFALAGCSALLVELAIMRSTLGLMPISGARTTAGFIAQGAAGAAGGWLFAALTTGLSQRRRADA